MTDNLKKLIEEENTTKAIYDNQLKEYEDLYETLKKYFNSLVGTLSFPKEDNYYIVSDINISSELNLSNSNPYYYNSYRDKSSCVKIDVKSLDSNNFVVTRRLCCLDIFETKVCIRMNEALYLTDKCILDDIYVVVSKFDEYKNTFIKLTKLMNDIAFSKSTYQNAREKRINLQCEEETYNIIDALDKNSVIHNIFVPGYRRYEALNISRINKGSYTLTFPRYYIDEDLGVKIITGYDKVICDKLALVHNIIVDRCDITHKDTGVIMYEV